MSLPCRALIWLQQQGHLRGGGIQGAPRPNDEWKGQQIDCAAGFVAGTVCIWAKHQLCIHADLGSNPDRAPWASHFSVLDFLPLK